MISYLQSLPSQLFSYFSPQVEQQLSINVEMKDEEQAKAKFQSNSLRILNQSNLKNSNDEKQLMNISNYSTMNESYEKSRSFIQEKQTISSRPVGQFNLGISSNQCPNIQTGKRIHPSLNENQLFTSINQNSFESKNLSFIQYEEICQQFQQFQIDIKPKKRNLMDQLLQQRDINGPKNSIIEVSNIKKREMKDFQKSLQNQEEKINTIQIQAQQLQDVLQEIQNKQRQIQLLETQNHKKNQQHDVINENQEKIQKIQKRIQDQLQVAQIKTQMLEMTGKMPQLYQQYQKFNEKIQIKKQEEQNLILGNKRKCQEAQIRMDQSIQQSNNKIEQFVQAQKTMIINQQQREQEEKERQRKLKEERDRQAEILRQQEILRKQIEEEKKQEDERIRKQIEDARQIPVNPVQRPVNPVQIPNNQILILGNEQYFQPNQSLIQRNIILKQEFILYTQWFDTHNLALKQQAIVILKNSHGDEENFNRFLNRRFQFSNPEENPQQKYEEYIQVLKECIDEFNNKKYSEDIFRMFLYEIIVQKLFDHRLNKQHAIDMLIKVFMEFKVEMITRMHFHFPNLNFIELFVSKCFQQNIYLIPQLPEELFPNDPQKQLDAMDIRLNGEGKRETYLESSNRIERLTNVLYAVLRTQAYIGRAWQMLIIKLSFPMRQQSSQILYHLLHMCSDKLLLSYRRPFIAVLKKITDSWIPQYEEYCNQRVFDEVQNRIEYLNHSEQGQNLDNTGVEITKQFTRKLREKCAEFLEKSNDPNYRGEGRFIDDQF